MDDGVGGFEGGRGAAETVGPGRHLGGGDGQWDR